MLLGLGMVVSTVVGAFEKVVAQLTLIVAFQSLILDMAGNVGTQSIAVTIRVLTDGSLTAKQKLHLVSKRNASWTSKRHSYRRAVVHSSGAVYFLLQGQGTGILLCNVGLYRHFTYTCHNSIQCSGNAHAAFSSRKIKIDPAVASGPMITTLNDLVAVVAYYGTSWIFLLNVLKLG